MANRLPMPPPPPPPPREHVPLGQVRDGAKIPAMVEYGYLPGEDLAPAYDEVDQIFEDIQSIRENEKARKKQNNAELLGGMTSGLGMDDGPGFA